MMIINKIGMNADGKHQRLSHVSRFLYRIINMAASPTNMNTYFFRSDFHKSGNKKSEPK